MKFINLASIFVLVVATVSVSCQDGSGESAANADAIDLADSAGSSGSDVAGEGVEQESPWGSVLPVSEQRDGDPEAGYKALVNEGYVGCGIPYSIYTMMLAAAGELAGAVDALKIEGREGKNADLPYMVNAFTTKSGVDVVSANCLTCHASWINGELVIGLGNSSDDLDLSQIAAQSGDTLLALTTDPAEKAELEKWLNRMNALSPYIQPLTIGANPADNIAAVLFSHRDPVTLEWSDEPLMDPPPPFVYPVDVPPWWHMSKKNAMLYVGAGRGDHARIMMTASTLCVDSVEEAEEIDAYFVDVRAYISSIEAPEYPFEIDEEKAEKGREVFETNCSHCHGTYGEIETYPNLLVPTDLVGTDPMLTAGASQFADRFVEWFNDSFYGELAHLVPGDGYVAPPLDGIWASAPYLHNGSVPTVELLLDSQARPTYWTRSFDSTDYNRDEIGWNFQVLDYGHEGESDPVERKKIYDTTLDGYGNGGHLFGDHLSSEKRAAVLEYLKSL